jgi:hypothetical protein
VVVGGLVAFLVVEVEVVIGLEVEDEIDVIEVENEIDV